MAEEKSGYYVAWAANGSSDLDGPKGQTVAWRPARGKAPARYVNILAGSGPQELVVAAGTPGLEVAPRLDMVNRLLISGQSGAGKSTFAGKWFETYMAWAGPMDVYIFSKVKEDEALDKIEDAQRVDLEELAQAEEPLSVEELKGAGVIFDDVDTIAEKPVRLVVQELRNDVLQTGRHQRIQTICINHLLTNGSETRKALMEATAVVLFPRSGAKYQIRRYLKEYCGFELDTIKKVMAVPSRWVYISRTYPGYVVHERGVFLV